MLLKTLRTKLSYLIVLSLLTFQVFATTKPKIIVDVDLHHNADDHEALVMLATLHNREALELLGVTLVAGNHRLKQIEVDTLRLVERLGMADELPVFRGADRPLLHSEEVFHRFEKKRYGSEYAGAWTESKEVDSPIDGMPTLKVRDEHAVNFIIETVRKNPGEITLVALGPLTNIALAIRMAPDIVTQLKTVIYMGGTIYAPGNVTPSAEFNWWFDAEAVKIVLGEPLRHIVIPLDATDQILFDLDIYHRFVNTYPNHSMTKTYLIPKFSKRFEENPDYSIPVWDALVPACMFDSTSVTTQKQLWLGIDTNKGPNYGRVIPMPVRNGEEKAPFQGAQKADVVMAMNEAKFWDIYDDLIFR